MKSSYSETPKPINPFTEDYSDYSKIGDITIDKIPYNDMVITCQVLKTFSNAADNKHLFLYLFPGQGDNEEWDKKADIARLMTYIQINVNRHPEMTIVMPHIYYGGSDKIIEAQQITEYIAKIVSYYEGENEWKNKSNYEKRAVAGLCLGSLCAMKCALHYKETHESDKCKGEDYLNNFKCVGVFSPANGAEDGYWLNGKPNFKFNNPQNHRLYLSYGEKDEKKVHAQCYYEDFKGNCSPVNDYVMIVNGEHNWNAFTAGFVDFMSKEIFDMRFYEKSIL